MQFLPCRKKQKPKNKNAEVGFLRLSRAVIVQDLGTCQECRFSGPHVDPGRQKLCGRAQQCVFEGAFQEFIIRIFIYLFIFVFLPFLGPLSQHMEVPRLGVESEL